MEEAGATLVVSHGPLRGGSRLTLDEVRRRSKPVLHLDLLTLDAASAAARLRDWLEIAQPDILNVAGPRASEDGDVYGAVADLLQAALNPH